jgi:hypothetical protein
MNNITMMEAEKKRLEAQLAKEMADYSLSNYPDGRLKIKKDGKYRKLFWVNDKNGGIGRTYIKKADIKVAQQLALKAYKESTIWTLKKQLQATNAYLRYYPQKSPDDLFRFSEEFRRLLQPMIPIRQDYKEWMEYKYERSTEHPERLIFPTMKGEKVRSKSEAMIADELYRRGIPYRYECRVDIGGHTIYPDFSIMDAASGQLILWEHFGMMDDPKYVSKYLWKIRNYVLNGYIPQINLITTYETEARPLTLSGVVKVIEQFFLM